MDIFRFRLNCVDHYQASPTELDPQLHRGLGNAFTVPVIRVFGATETGQKVCAHIHGVLPYLYLDYHGSLEQDAVNAYIHNVRISIDHALAISYRRSAYNNKPHFVGHITLIKGVPYYGYHVGYRFFLKVYMLNPLHMTRLADLLHQGAILGKAMQPYESHLQYLLQWMCDYNLYGCAYIDCAKVRFRNPVPEHLKMNNLAHKWHDSSIKPEWKSDEDQFPRQSHCSIEVDVCVQDILNRNEIRARLIHHDFMESLSNLALDERLLPSMASLWRDESARRKRRMGLTDLSSSPFPPEVLVSMSANLRNTDKGGWVHEEEYRKLVEQLAEAERNQSDSKETSPDHFVRPFPKEQEVKTALESVGDLFPQNLEAFYAIQDRLSETGAARDQAVERAFVNEDCIENLVQEDSSYDSDEEMSREITLSPGRGIFSFDIEEPRQANDGKDTIRDELHLDMDVYGNQSQDSNGSVKHGILEEGNALKSDDEFGSFNEDIFVEFDRTPGQKRGSPEIVKQPHKRPRLPQDDVANETSSAATGLVHGRSSFLVSPLVQSITLTKETILENSHADKVSTGHDSSLRKAQSLSQSSQSSIKAHGIRGPNTLSFPVVKNPHDPQAALRLTQLSGWSNSQGSSQTSAKSRPSSNTKMSPQTLSSGDRSAPCVASSDSIISSQALLMAINLQSSSSWSSNSRILYFSQLPPSACTVATTMLEYGRLPVIYQEAYYGNEKDVPERPRWYAGQEFRLESVSVPYLPVFDPTGASAANFGKKPGVIVDKAKEEINYRQRRGRCTFLNWEIAATPPSFEDVKGWLHYGGQLQQDADVGEVDVDLLAERQRHLKRQSQLSQIDGPTQKNKHGFKYSHKLRSTSVQREMQYMSIMSLEVHINTRGTLLPDPAVDEVACVFWCIQADDQEAKGLRMGVLALSGEDGVAKRIAQQLSIEVHYEEDELNLINRMVDIVRQLDPDILTGYEVHNGSWGYLIERARRKFDYNLCDEFSRMKAQSHGRFGKEADRWGFTHTSTIRVTGRHMINIWRAMRGELNLLQYTIENVAFHLLHKRIPHYSHKDLTNWFQNEKPRDLSKVLTYFLSRVQMNLDILEANELISRTSEQARLLGVDFFSVFSRGSQFKVESLMFRIAKPENFILISPSRKQVGQQNALECLPLVMEPQSAFYNSPLLVLDFQSLYPSVMIAYNYCYSTCLGRIVSWRGQNKMGFTNFKREPGLLELLKDHVNIAPNGIMYVKPEVRRSLLAKMLSEILETRVMVKSGMKVEKDDKTLQQLLNNRQLALKLIANVTYGYTSASFSGRMPCSEIADSIVQTGRETLEKAIALIHSVQRWGAEVVYGDTDSLFVYLKGRTKEEAFNIGDEIAKAVTEANPRPIKLKFEKVYHPCVLLAKKRYVGFKYESRQQKEPEFDAKGIETVRRDGTPAEQKIEEKALKILFRTADLSEVKRYFQRQCMKIMAGKISIQDFLFAKEVKLGTYLDKGPGPPGALIAARRMLEDPRAEPQYGERIPYVVITGAPGARLIDRCVSPETLLLDDQIELDAEYYISKNLIPPLERIFNLVGANVRGWYDEITKVQRVRNVTAPLASSLQKASDSGNALILGQTSKKILENYMQSSACLVCRAKLASPSPNAAALSDPPLPLCEVCAGNPARALFELRQKQQREEMRAQRVDMVCRSCSSLTFGEEVRCDSRDCPVFYTRVRERANVQGLKSGLKSVLRALENKTSALDW